MPLFDYRCTTCDHQFEILVRGREAVTCPACGAPRPEKLLSVPAPHRAGTPVPSSCATPGSPAGGCCGGGCGLN